MNNRPYKICIDAGHGGGDPGAINKTLDIKEKDITLNVARFMYHYSYQGDYLFESSLTREQDEFVSIKARCEKANSNKCNAFMSIHTNARYHPGKPGIEIEIFHYDKSKKGREFANITLGILLNKIKEQTEVISRGVKEGNYYVLKHTKMTSILVELGFITDNEEALFLNTPKNQVIMAKALNEATELFLEGGGI